MYTAKNAQQPSTGDLVLITEPFGTNAAGTRGIIYHTEVDDDVVCNSVILDNGHDIGTFSALEVSASLKVVGHSSLRYDYTTPTQLQADFKAGYFDTAWASLPQYQ